MITRVAIEKMSLKQRSLLFAKLSQIAYNDKRKVAQQIKPLGFTEVEYYDRDGAQAYRIWNKDDVVIVCRGTEPKEFNDLKADLKAFPVKSETVSRVHQGFKQEVDDLWPMVKEDILANPKLGNRHLWFTGHSLGAAMTTIMAGRCMHDPDLQDPVEVYTYGSPRAGWKKYVRDLNVTHHRWVNNNDIVTRVPFASMGYRHDGTEHYMNAYGNVRKLTSWQRVKDRWRGMWMGLKKGGVDNFSDHSMVNYVANLEKWNNDMETAQPK